METDFATLQRVDLFTKIHQEKSLLIAIGNDARQDDGLGWAFADGLKETKAFPGQLFYCYQLQIEDAELISNYPLVVFVDATTEPLPMGYALEKVSPENDFTFTTHALTPMAVLFLCQDLFGQQPEAYVLKIRGSHWELETGLSKVGKEHLFKALEFFITQLEVELNL